MIDHMTDIQSGATYKLSLQQGQEFTVLFHFYFTLRDIFNLIITVSLWSIWQIIFLSQVIFVFVLCLGMAMYANEVETRKINKNYLRWKINYNININFYIVVKILENCRSFLNIIFTPRSQDCSEGFDAIFHSLWCWWLGRLPLNSYLRSSLCHSAPVETLQNPED